MENEAKKKILLTAGGLPVPLLGILNKFHQSNED